MCFGPAFLRGVLLLTVLMGVALSTRYSQTATAAPMDFETFDRPSLAAWDLTDGAIHRKEKHGGTLRLTGNSQALWKAGPISDGRLDFRFFLPEAHGAGTILLRRSPGDLPTYYSLRIDPDGMALKRWYTGNSMSIANVKAAIRPNEWHDLTLWMRDGELDIWLDSKPILLAHDSDPLLGNQFGLSTSGSNSLEIDAVRFIDAGLLTRLSSRPAPAAQTSVLISPALPKLPAQPVIFPSDADIWTPPLAVKALAPANIIPLEAQLFSARRPEDPSTWALSRPRSYIHGS
jgi:hypothetical protein